MFTYAVFVFDPLQYFSWWAYLAVGAVYSGLVFGGELLPLRSLLFSKRNARPLSAILAIHIAFLAILLGLMRVAVSVSPSLPDWMTEVHRASGLDLVFIAAMFGILRLEQRLVYLESKTNASDVENSPTQSSAIRK